MAETCTLKGGPRDGEKVTKPGEGKTLPNALFVGLRPMGDGFAAWGDEPCDRFPCEYRRTDAGFTFSKEHRADRLHAEPEGGRPVKVYRTTDFDGIEEMPSACPWCGFAMKYVVVRGWSGYLSCEGYGCHAQGPVGETKAECVATWNRVAANRMDSTPQDVLAAAIRHACRLDGDRSNFVGQDNAAGFLADVQLMARYLCNSTGCFPDLLKALRYAKWFGSHGTVNSDNEDDGKSVSYFIDAAIAKADRLHAEPTQQEAGGGE